MDPQATSPLDPELLAQLAEAGLDLRHYGELWILAEERALRRAEEQRGPFPAELALETRLAGERGRQEDAIEIVRIAASEFPDAFNAAVAASLSDEVIDPDARAVFERGIGAVDGDFASVAQKLCDRIGGALRNPVTFPGLGDAELPPVGGGESLGCDLIIVAGLACGTTCIIGCGPCCVCGVATVLGYAAFC